MCWGEAPGRAATSFDFSFKHKDCGARHQTNSTTFAHTRPPNDDTL